MVVEEVKTLTGMLEDQLGYLDIPRDQAFQLRQDNNGGIIVGSSGSDALNESISSKLNASEHFKETFHLLKTAEKVLANNMSKEENDRMVFDLYVGGDGVRSDISLDKSHDAPQSITDMEMYHLARYGIAARKTQTVYLKV